MSEQYIKVFGRCEECRGTGHIYDVTYCAICHESHTVLDGEVWPCGYEPEQTTFGMVVPNDMKVLVRECPVCHGEKEVSVEVSLRELRRQLLSDT